MRKYRIATRNHIYYIVGHIELQKNGQLKVKVPFELSDEAFKVVDGDRDVNAELRVDCAYLFFKSKKCVKGIETVLGLDKKTCFSVTSNL